MQVIDGKARDVAIRRSGQRNQELRSHLDAYTALLGRFAECHAASWPSAPAALLPLLGDSTA